jgi:hypothetical protein
MRVSVDAGFLAIAFLHLIEVVRRKHGHAPADFNEAFAHNTARESRMTTVQNQLRLGIISPA